jgi:hypothetical protein
MIKKKPKSPKGLPSKELQKDLMEVTSLRSEEIKLTDGLRRTAMSNDNNHSEESPEEEYELDWDNPLSSITDIISSQNGDGYWTLSTITEILSVSKEEILKQHPEPKKLDNNLNEIEVQVYQNCWATVLVLAYLKLKFSDKSTLLEPIIRKSSAYLSSHNLSPDQWNEESKRVVQKYLS